MGDDNAVSRGIQPEVDPICEGGEKNLESELDKPMQVPVSMKPSPRPTSERRMEQALLRSEHVPRMQPTCGSGKSLTPQGVPLFFEQSTVDADRGRSEHVLGPARAALKRACIRRRSGAVLGITRPTTIRRASPWKSCSRGRPPSMLSPRRETPGAKRSDRWFDPHRRTGGLQSLRPSAHGTITGPGILPPVIGRRRGGI